MAELKARFIPYSIPPLTPLSFFSPHLFLGRYCSSEQQVKQTLRQGLLSTLRLWQQLEKRRTQPAQVSLPLTILKLV